MKKRTDADRLHDAQTDGQIDDLLTREITIDGKLYTLVGNNDQELDADEALLRRSLSEGKHVQFTRRSIILDLE